MGYVSDVVTDAAIEEMTRSIAETLLNRGLEPLQAPDGLSAGPRSLFAWVKISGAWAGSVMIGCSEGLAKHAAGTMFDMPPEDTTPSDVADAVGELANVLGGNVKGLVPAPSALSLPIVSAHRGEDPPHAIASREMWFHCRGEPLVVRIVEAQAGAA